MAVATSVSVPNLWDSSVAQELDPVGQLIYASNLLGSDPRITNFGGGNTSSKFTEIDPLTGEQVTVLWVKGSGGDIGTAKRHNFASLYQDRLVALIDKFHNEGLHEDDIVPLYSHCTFNLNPTACSIDTPLHAFVPAACVSHLHSDSVIAIAASANSEKLTQEAFGGKMGFLPWKRPGFELGLQLKAMCEANASLKGAMMGSHGFICWAETWEECYTLSIELINEAADYIASKTGSTNPFGDVVAAAETDPRGAWLSFLPELRGRVAHEGLRLYAKIDTSAEALEFVTRAKLDHLGGLGTSCPDHFLRTKIRPLILRDRSDLDGALSRFRAEYAAYYERCKHPNSPAMRNPNPSVILVPGLGLLSFGKTPTEARVTGEFYKNAIAVMRGAESIDTYTALPEQEAFNIEYWLLEEAKLKRMPPEKEFSRQVALITGGAQGIGRATALKLAQSGASVVLLDLNEERLVETVSEVAVAAGSAENVKGIRCDVTDEAAVAGAFEEAILAYGGVDIVVVSAGNARRGTVVDTSDGDYEFMSNLLMKAYFDAMSQACKVMIRQGTGGSIVVVASKNGVAVGSNAAAYSAAKAFELHLMRCTASDMAKHNIRCNAINPDAVLEGSGIWNDKWRNETAKLLGIPPEDLNEHYRKRSMLGVTVSANDCAEAICWLASEKRSSRTTGCVIPVDGGIREGFLR